jgi:hypothetical protein
MRARRWFGVVAVGLAVLALLGGGAGRANADVTLWYNGDFDGRNSLANGNSINDNGNSLTVANVYDDFIVPAGPGWTIHSVFSNNDMNFTAATAFWAIRTGVSSGNGGTVVASGTGAVTQTPTGRVNFGTTEYTISVSGLDVVLAPGTYWLAVSPIDSGTGFSFLTTTSGANHVGNPPGNDGNSFITASGSVTLNFQPASDFTLDSPSDFSEGVVGMVTAVPEPSSLALCGAGLLGLVGYAQRRRAARA